MPKLSNPGPLALYTDNNRFCCKWLDNLIRAGELPAGVTWCGNIEWIKELDAKRYEAIHWFAGIGGWPLALKIAGWPAGRRVWTGSCPCQPFSNAGKRRGFDDERHLWPEWLRLIAQHRPATIFGEQVASNLGRQWLAGVRVDLEALGYAVGAVDLCAASAGAPHIRQRLFWVADCESNGYRSASLPGSYCQSETQGRSVVAGRHGTASGLADTNGAGLTGVVDTGADRARGAAATGEAAWCADEAVHYGGVGNTERKRDEDARRQATTGATSGMQGEAWKPSDLIACSDGKLRRIEPGVCPLAHGVPNRVELLAGCGNTIVPQVGAAFVRAFLEAEAAVERQDVGMNGKKRGK